MKQQAEFCVYILECENGSFYTGYTNDLPKRFEAHVNGTASKFTRSFKPIRIAQCWPAENKSAAMKIERKIKNLSKVEKIKLIAQPNLLADALE